MYLTLFASALVMPKRAFTASAPSLPVASLYLTYSFA